MDDAAAREVPYLLQKRGTFVCVCDHHQFLGVRELGIFDMAMSRHTDRRRADARPPGFRASCENRTTHVAKFPRDVSEISVVYFTARMLEPDHWRSHYLERPRMLTKRLADHLPPEHSLSTLEVKR